MDQYTNRSVTNYIGTLIFCIIVKGVSIVLLILLLTNIGQKWQYTLLTVEVSLILLVMYSLFQIQQIENKIINQYKQSKQTNIELSSCPDYYVKKLENNEVICTSTYSTPDSKFIYDMAPKSNELKEINLTKLADDGNNNLDGICSIVTKGDFDSKLAWTDLKTKCI